MSLKFGEKMWSKSIRRWTSSTRAAGTIAIRARSPPSRIVNNRHAPSRLKITRGFSTGATPLPVESAERRYRWWEPRPGEEGAPETVPVTVINWWEQPQVDWEEEDRQKRELFATGHQLLGESVVARPPPQQLFGIDDERVEKMDSIVEPLIHAAKTEEERAYLRTFLGRECLVGVDFFSPEAWTEFWRQMSEDYAEKQAAWNEDYEKRVDARRQERIRENDGVESEVSKVFSSERAEQLFGPDWRNHPRKLNGYVLEKKNDVYLVEWALPGLQSERVVHHGTTDLEPIFPEEYVPDFDEFKYVPDTPLSAETWMNNCIVEHPLLVIVETRDCPSYRRIQRVLRGCQYGTLDLSVADVPEGDRKKLKEFIVNRTNWPTFPQLFLSATFMGGLENMDALLKDGSLETVLVMAGVKQKHVVNKEVDRYEEMVEEMIREWRYNQIDQLTKYFQREESKESCLKGNSEALADYKIVRALEKGVEDESRTSAGKLVKRDRAAEDQLMEKKTHFRERHPDAAAKIDAWESKSDLLRQLQNDKGVTELFFEHYRNRFLDESALEIERLTGEVQETRSRYLIPDDDERISLSLLRELVQFPHLAKAPVRAEIETLYRQRYPEEAAQRQDKDEMEQAVADGGEALHYNVTDGPTSSTVPGVEVEVYGTEARTDDNADDQQALSEEEAREEVDAIVDGGDRQEQLERQQVVRLIREVNKYIDGNWGRVKKKKFYTDYVSKYLTSEPTE